MAYENVRRTPEGKPIVKSEMTVAEKLAQLGRVVNQANQNR
jgi:hypothetical protein